VTPFHHQPEAQHPKSSAIHKLPADYPIYWTKADKGRFLPGMGLPASDPTATLAMHCGDNFDANLALAAPRSTRILSVGHAGASYYRLCLREYA
jgi:hypothetical protein